MQRSKWLARKYGIKTFRFWLLCLMETAEVRIKQLLGISSKFR